MPSAGGARFVAEGSEEAAEVKESVKVSSKGSNVAVAAMVWCLTVFRKLRCADELWNGSFSRLGLRRMGINYAISDKSESIPVSHAYFVTPLQNSISSILEAIETVSYAS